MKKPRLVRCDLVSTDSAQPPRYGYDVTIRWPDGRTLISQSSSESSLDGVAAVLRSLARDVAWHADQIEAEDGHPAG